MNEEDNMLLMEKYNHILVKIKHNELDNKDTSELIKLRNKMKHYIKKYIIYR